MFADELVCASACGGQRLGLLLCCFPLCVLRGDLSLKPELAVLARLPGRQAPRLLSSCLPELVLHMDGCWRSKLKSACLCIIT